LRRLLRIRDLEEEQRRMALESALAGLSSLEQAHRFLRTREHVARGLIASSIVQGDMDGRLAAIEEVYWANRRAEALLPGIEAAEVEVGLRRQEFLAKRVERRQTESLIDAASARDAAAAEKRTQQAVDDWYAMKLPRKGGGGGSET
jgi:hypothetical protein